MKRRVQIFMAVLFCFLLLFPMTVCAQTYNVSETDMSVIVDDSKWYVFTRDNIENNPELEELGVSYDTVHGFLYDNNAYMDAVLYYENGENIEFFIRKNATDSGMVNLSNYSHDDVLEVAQALAEKQGAEDYSVYETDYKFAKLEYIDSEFDYYICEFFTTVNKDCYTLTFQSATPFSESAHNEIKGIVDSVQFDVDTSLEEDNGSFLDGAISGAVRGAIVGGGAALVGILVRKITKKRGQNVDDSNAEGSNAE